jgi:hypothetical protein
MLLLETIRYFEMNCFGLLRVDIDKLNLSVNGLLLIHLAGPRNALMNLRTFSSLDEPGGDKRFAM